MIRIWSKKYQIIDLIKEIYSIDKYCMYLYVRIYLPNMLRCFEVVGIRNWTGTSNDVMRSGVARTSMSLETRWIRNVILSTSYGEPATRLYVIYVLRHALSKCAYERIVNIDTVCANVGSLRQKYIIYIKEPIWFITCNYDISDFYDVLTLFSN